MSEKKHVYIVVTVVRFGDDDVFGDIITLTDDEQRAKKIAKALEQRKNVRRLDGKGMLLDYNQILPYSSATYVQRDIEGATP